MSDKILLDTNLWVYLYAKQPEAKYLKIREIISDNLQDIIVSTQILGELYNVMIKKNITTKQEAKEIILEIITNFAVIEIDTFKVLQALEINSKYGYSYWDSLIIATALLAECPIIYSEDMHHNQLIENKTRIVNPYL